ncbi:MAG: hypothetical protein JWP95_1806 [Actinotalea sp.]|nr:hypothetical protein [Actinotalea sp.]
MSARQPPAPDRRRVPVEMTAEQRRRQRRRRWLIWGSLPVWLPVVVLSLVLLGNDINTGAGIRLFDDEQYPAAVSRFAAVDGADVVERWRAPFNRGTAELRDDNLWRAQRHLDRALELVPDDQRCMVQINRAHVLEAWGDLEMVWSAEEALWAEQAQELVDAGEPYPPDAPWDERAPWEMRAKAQEYASYAEADYEAAIEAREDPACEDESQASPDQQGANAQNREGLEEKRQEAEDTASPPEPEEPEPGDPEAEEAQRQAELAERNAQAQTQAEAERQAQADDRDVAEPGGETKNW